MYATRTHPRNLESVNSVKYEAEHGLVVAYSPSDLESSSEISRRVCARFERALRAHRVRVGGRQADPQRRPADGSPLVAFPLL
eukprot:6183848-Pleurochrysis_carterae.AAC.1